MNILNWPFNKIQILKNKLTTPSVMNFINHYNNNNIGNKNNNKSNNKNNHINNNDKNKNNSIYTAQEKKSSECNFRLSFVSGNYSKKKTS